MVRALMGLCITFSPAALLAEEPGPTGAPAALPEPPPAAPAAPAPQAVADSPPPAAAVAMAAPPATTSPAASLKVGVLAQGWFYSDHVDDKSSSTFRLRRVEISAKGSVVPDRIAYNVMIDVAKIREFQEVDAGGGVKVKQPVSAVSALQDVAMTFLSSHIDVTFGQFKTPVSLEGLQPAAQLLFPERAPEAITFGDKRDLGIKVSKTFARWGYTAGLFNGGGLNNLDGNNGKDVALRLEAYPVSNVLVGAVAYMTVGDRDSAGAKDRYEGDLRVQQGPLRFQGEYIRARDVRGNGTAVDAQGFAGTLSGRFGELEPAVRAGYLDSDLGTDMGELVHYDVGLTYHLRGDNAKLQASVVHYAYDGRPDKNEGIVAAQVWF